MVNHGTNIDNMLERKYNGWKHAEKLITFIGGTANAIGDYDGTGDPFSIFNVTGTVVVKVVGICETDLAGVATIEVGIAGDTAIILAQVSDASSIDAGDIWHDATVDKGVELSSVMLEKIVANGADIIGSIGAAHITSGAIRFICLWKPLSIDGEVVAA
jgi:hypothetical protein